MVFVIKKGTPPSKSEIVNAVKNNILILDKGLKLIGEGTGPAGNIIWDLVGVDEDGILALISIQSEFTNAILYELLKGVDWAWSNREILSKIYPSLDIEVNQLPVIYLIAPEFPSRFRKIISQFINVRIKLVKFISVDLRGDKGIILEPEGIQELNEGIDRSLPVDIQPPELSPITEITDEELREFFEE